MPSRLRITTMSSTGLLYILSLLIISIFFHNAQAKPHGDAINGGDLAGKNQFPYHALIYFANTTDFRCGGAIISKKHILTAAHCVLSTYGYIDGAIQVKVGIGSIAEPSKIIDVKRIYIPWEFIPNELNKEITNREADIAVLKLSKSLYLSRGSGIEAVALPQPKGNRFDTLTNQMGYFYSSFQDNKAVVTGFGWNHAKTTKDKYGHFKENGTSDGQLRYGDSIVIGNVDCQRMLNITLNRSNICAQMTQDDNWDFKRGVCTMDSGGPLVTSDIIIGVLSASSKGCSERLRPARYTRVSYYTNFIKNAINENDLSQMRAAESTVDEIGDVVYKLLEESHKAMLVNNYFDPEK